MFIQIVRYCLNVTVKKLRDLAEINVFSASIQAHQCAWYVVKRSEASIDHQGQFELMEYISAAERELCRHDRRSVACQESLSICYTVVLVTISFF